MRPPAAAARAFLLARKRRASPMHLRIQQFVREYLIDLNASAAARRCGYPEHVARVRGSKLMARKDVQAAVRQAMAERAARTGVTADRVLLEYARIAFADARKYFDWGPHGVKILPAATLDDDAAAAVAILTGGYGKRRHVHRLRLHDKQRALDMLARHVGLWTDRRKTYRLGPDARTDDLAAVARAGREARATLRDRLEAADEELMQLAHELEAAWREGGRRRRARTIKGRAKPLLSNQTRAASSGPVPLAFRLGFPYLKPTFQQPTRGVWPSFRIKDEAPFRCWSRARRRTGSHAPRRPNRRKDAVDGDSRFHHAPAFGSRRAFRPPHPPLEPEDGAVHLRRAQRRAHHQSRRDRADARPCAPDVARRRRRRRPRALRRHQAPGAGTDCRRRQALRPVFRQPSLARRHVDELQDHLGVDQAAQGSRREDFPARSRHHQARAARTVARPRQARTRPRRHQGNGRPARHPVRDRHQ